MKSGNKRGAMALVVIVAGLFVHTSSAAVIDIEGRLADSTETSALEWGDNSTRGDSGGTVAIGSNKPDSVFDDDGIVTLTVAANIQDWRTGYSTGSYNAGAEWNIRSSSTATSEAGAISAGAYFEISLDSIGHASDQFSWDAISVSLWRNGSGADTHFQLAIDVDNDGFTVDDLIGIATMPAAGIGGASTISYSGAELDGNMTSGSIRLYTWGSSSVSGNIHLYDVSAEYTVIPEPATLGLIAVFGGGLLFMRRRVIV
ncbi:MAG: PEP-CTERM sorting domain-containing protein [Pontiella sp.]